MTDCDHYGNLTICRTPSHRQVYGRTNRRWCFKCRKRHVHDKVRYVPKDVMSYYEPHAAIECRGCGGDFTAFPCSEMT